MTPTLARATREPVALVPIADVEPFVLALGWRDGSRDLVVQRALDLVLAGVREPPVRLRSTE